MHEQWDRSAVVLVFHLSALTATLVLYGSVVLFSRSSVLVLPKLEELRISQLVFLETCQW